MTLFVLGINHVSAPLELREQLVFTKEAMATVLQDLICGVDIAEAAILSTCNRTELYLSGSCQNISDRVQQWLVSYCHVDANRLVDCHYSYHNEAAIEHMMKVASGLDPMVLGEPQILGQMKSCYVIAQNTETLGSELHRIFQWVFSTAKQVRSQTAIGESPVSI